MLRRALFALVLVGSAFAGGAAINGPGLAWLQRSVLGGPTIIVDGTTAPPPAGSKKAPNPFPTAKASPLRVEMPRAPEKKKPAAVVATAAEAEPPPPPESAAALVRPADASSAPALAGEARPPAELALDLGPATKADPVARLASGVTPSPSTAVGTAPAPTTTPTRDWAEIRKRLKALGVARYSLEAETEGRVKFSCVIPVDGLRAVGHHFEAEGDDEHQAAEATLRRVALWQATETPASKDSGLRTRD